MVVFSFAVDVLLFGGCLVVFPLLAISAFAAALVVFSFAVDLFLRSGAAWWSFPLLSTCFCVRGCLVVARHLATSSSSSLLNLTLQSYKYNSIFTYYVVGTRSRYG